VAGVSHVVHECSRTGARLLFTSSGAVFDGEEPEYREDSEPTPLSVYGKTKTDAENILAAELPGSIVVRLSLVLGAGLHAGTNSLFDKVRRSFEAGELVTSVDGEYRNAIHVETAARWILDLAASPNALGIFHLGSSDALSRLEILRRLAQVLGHSEDLVVVQQDPVRGRAPRGARQLLLPTRIQEFSQIPVPTCQQVIERCVYAVA
jgi:dTDP-4-dehydrorhamnose reductase